MTLRHDEEKKQHIKGKFKFVAVSGNCCWQVEDRRLLGGSGSKRRYLGDTMGKRKNDFNVKSITRITCPSVKENEV